MHSCLNSPISLSSKGLRALSETLLELNSSDQTEEQMFERLVARCSTLIPHTNMFVAFTDRHLKSPTTYFGPWADLAHQVTPAFNRHLSDHPRFLHHCLSGELLVDAVSGHVSQRNWRSTGMFDEVFKGSGSEDEIVASQPLNERLTVSLVVNRAGWGFTREESSLLALLVPHVVQAWRTHTLVRRLQAAAERKIDGWSGGDLQVITDSHGNLIEISSDEALGRLWDLFREPRLESAARLPEQLRRWMADALTSHFERGESTVRGSLHYELKAPNGETLRAFLPYA